MRFITRCVSLIPTILVRQRRPWATHGPGEDWQTWLDARIRNLLQPLKNW
jgi:hypothetical protein